MSVAPARAIQGHHRRARIVAICTGVFVLARAGLLDGRRASTHWRHAPHLAAASSQVEVDPDVLYVNHGDVATSAGTGAGIDLCLHLARSDHGAAYAAQPTPARTDTSLAPLMEWATSHLDSPPTPAQLAGRAGLSARTHARRFTEQLGVSPGQWLLRRRLDAARVLLERTDLPVEAIATVPDSLLRSTCAAASGRIRAPHPAPTGALSAEPGRLPDGRGLSAGRRARR